MGHETAARFALIEALRAPVDVPSNNWYGTFNDCDGDGTMIVHRRRDVVRVAIADNGYDRGRADVQLTPADAIRFGGALAAAVVDALTWEEQNR